jgi:exopolyphosphatase/guanosine-5'-triphosphate,3'-diphosphate pyrophosphatase
MSSLREEALALRHPFDEEPSHSDHVTRLALELFDGLASWHRLRPRDRELLEAAALLHDIGWSQCPDGRAHHKASARMITEHTWENLSAKEVPVVAQIARYHRKALPGSSHDAFQELPRIDRQRVTVLGGILRIADALDRTHRRRVKGVEVTVSPEELVVRLRAPEPCPAERETFEIKADLLRRASGREVRCEPLCSGGL